MQFDGDTLMLDRTPSELDELVLDLVATLDKEGIKYTIVSGYVSILTGRSRATEDIRYRHRTTPTRADASVRGSSG